MTFAERFKRKGEQAKGRQNNHAGNYYQKAEALRKAGKLEAAEKKYLAAIDAGENDAMWQKVGPEPAMYESLAKMYCHMNQDKSALDILDRYLNFCEFIWKEDIAMKLLRERIVQGGFERAKVKGESTTIIDYGAD